MGYNSYINNLSESEVGVCRGAPNGELISAWSVSNGRFTRSEDLAISTIFDCYIYHKFTSNYIDDKASIWFISLKLPEHDKFDKICLFFCLID